MISIRQSLLDNFLPSHLIGRIAGKVATLRPAKDLNERFYEDIERLALSSPHLLADVGFKRDISKSSTKTEVWRNGDHSITFAKTTSLTIKTE